MYLDWIKNNITIVTSYLLIIGIVRLVVFYNYFGIDITSYLDFSEVIQSQYRFYLIVISCLILYSMYTIIKGEAPKTKAELEYDSTKETPVYDNKKSKNSLETAAFIFFILFVLFDSIAVYCNWHNNPGIEIVFLLFSFPMFIGLCFCTYFILVWVEDKNAVETELQKNSDTIFFSMLLVISIYVCAVMTHGQAITLVTEPPTQQVIAVTEKRVNITNANYLFIGKTKSYLFFYDKLKRKTDIIKYDNIKELSFQELAEQSTVDAKQIP